MRKIFQQISKTMTTKYTFSETLSKLDSLLLFKIPPNERPKDVRQFHNLLAMNNYIGRLNIDLNQLSFLHVAGTKGKGSTCTFCENILRKNGLKTGLFTSPHLLDIRERIKVNGEPIDEETFIRNFWDVFERLESSRNDMFPSMATYFRILTCMAFQIFIEEEVDVAILEVGLGGRLDATNIIENPVVCGITHIGYDHCHILGNTLPEIASEKAGIIKKGVPVVTYSQRTGVIEQFTKKAEEKNTRVFMAPTFETIVKGHNEEELGRIDMKMLGKHQKINASLAIALCDIYMKEKKESGITNKLEVKKEDTNVLSSYPPSEIVLSKETVCGINECRLEGRGHVINFVDDKVSFYMDGAHTNDSVNLCCEWYLETLKYEERPSGWFFGTKAKKKVEEEEEGEEKSYREVILDDDDGKKHQLRYRESSSGNGKETRILVFNYTGEREPKVLLEPLLKHHKEFDYVLFVPLDSSKESLTNKPEKGKVEKALKKLKGCQEVWNNFFSEEEDELKKPETVLLNGIDECLTWLWNREDKEVQVSVLVTGSLYLVGDFLRKLGKMNE